MRHEADSFRDSNMHLGKIGRVECFAPLAFCGAQVLGAEYRRLAGAVRFQNLVLPFGVGGGEFP